jgi:hypothetical protein
LILSADSIGANGDCCVVESFESEHRPCPLFDSLVVLFNEIGQVLAQSHFYSARKFAGLLHFPHSAIRSRICVQRDLGGCAPALHRTAQITRSMAMREWPLFGTPLVLHFLKASLTL